MRRTLCWLPALALVACQADAPTAIDGPIQADKSLPDNRVVVVADNVINGRWELLWAVLPGETRWGVGWMQVVPPGNEPFVYMSVAGERFFSDWTGDGIDDLVFGFDAFNLCWEARAYELMAGNYRTQFTFVLSYEGELVVEQPLTVFCPVLEEYP